MKNVPILRFPDYTDEWEKWKLGDICERVTRKNKNNESELPLTISSQYGLIDQRDFFNKIVAAKDMSNYYLLKKGEFAYNKSYSNGYDYGSIKRLNAYEQGCLSTLYICFSLNSEEVDSDYLECYFDTLRWYADISAVCSEGARNHGLLNVDTKAFFTDVYIDVPKNNGEQKQIATFINKLDDFINLYQRKYDRLIEYKSCMLQKMFPQEGERTPRVRFPGFTDAWEQRKFCEFVKNVAKKNKDNLDLEPYAVTNDRGFIAQKDAHDDFGYMKDTDRTTYNIVPTNSFAYNPARINVGSLGYYTGVENVIVSSLYEVFQTADYVDDRFLWHWLKSEHFSKWIEKLQEGSVRLYFYFDKLVQCQMMMPSIEEQKQISVYLDNIDKLITLHQRKSRF